ncbi:hypothetical protein COEREDRAFT_88095 [Coemansia reversa NRRL 1564]|uniref:Uncharacterized protein n=1 Tax=Coemansia reversa (strain ATCC 12441 / NRRL 1564) TaxID=763665 RepID=A0A2G5B8C6_COERN|nr:hypothetical protein COEREDRAFT_88095 [Coemansia reversa NRRL 1564]|eukprot:PIA15251.1 hypothetical protein COEREDRAFT_88095 [Coemansia reversa NRRL 1564]
MASPLVICKDPTEPNCIEREMDSTKSKQPIKPLDKLLPDPGGINTARGFDDLTPHERDKFLYEIEIDFRRHISETSSRTGFVIYPNTRQLLRAISTLYQTLSSIDFTDIAL